MLQKEGIEVASYIELAASLLQTEKIVNSPACAQKFNCGSVIKGGASFALLILISDVAPHTQQDDNHPEGS